MKAWIVLPPLFFSLAFARSAFAELVVPSNWTTVPAKIWVDMTRYIPQQVTIVDLYSVVESNEHQVVLDVSELNEPSGEINARIRAS